MIAYFDSDKCGNFVYDVFRVPYDPGVWTFCFNPTSPNFVNAGFVPTYDKHFSGKGIYYVSVKKHADYWSGLVENTVDSSSPPKHILEYINPTVLLKARHGKIIIVIDNQAEGNSLHRNGFDAYAKFHRTMQHLKLPAYSVLFVDSNKNFVTDYENWCSVTRSEPKIAHSYALTGFYYFEKDGSIPTRPLILDAIENENSADFNSLNRTARLHRMEHLYYLLKRGLHKNNLVSGHAVNRENQKLNPEVFSSLISVESKEFVDTLNEHLPLSVDGNWAQKNPDDGENTLFNHDIYKNSLLSFVTETEFSDRGLFITEKIFKPIVAGHPFIVLAQEGTLDYMRELGYKVDFSGIDSSYDKIKNPRERFFKVHEELVRWVNFTREEKIEHLRKSMDMIEHNLELFKTKNYALDSYVRMKNTIEDIFAKKYRKFTVEAP